MADNYNLDLDALAPKEVTIDFQGKKITVKPIEVEQYAVLINLGTKLSKISDKNKPEEITEVYAEMRDLIGKIVPELSDTTLNPAQLMAVFDFLCEVNTPSDKVLKELEERGVKPKVDKANPKAKAA